MIAGRAELMIAGRAELMIAGRAELMIAERAELMIAERAELMIAERDNPWRNRPCASTVSRTQERRWSETLSTFWTCEVAAR